LLDLTEITIYSTSSLQDIYNNLPFIEKTGDGKQLLQDVSLYLGIKYLTFRVRKTNKKENKIK
jgi:hypothetical protein